MSIAEESTDDKNIKHGKLAKVASYLFPQLV